MTLGKSLVRQLQLLATEGPHAVDAYESETGIVLGLPEQHGNRSVSLSLRDVDRYSATLRSLRIGMQPVAGAISTELLNSHAESLVRALSFLEEPLATWELEGSLATMQLRSRPPQRDGEEISYWELTLQLGENAGAELQRCRWSPELTEREVIDYPATFALLGRLTDAINSGLNQPTAV